MFGQLAVVFLAVVGGTLNATADFTPVKTASPPELTFDVPDGYQETITTEVNCRINAVRATARFTRFGRQTTRYVPGVTVMVHGTKFVTALYIGAHEFEPPFRVEMVRYFKGRKEPLDDIRFTSPVGADGTFSFLRMVAARRSDRAVRK